MRKLGLFGAALLAVGLTAPLAGAAGKGGRVGVVVLRGAGEGVVRGKITDALKANGYQVVGGQQLESTASGLSVSLDSDAGFKAVAKELNISAFVAGELTRKKAELVVRNGADGVVLGDASFSGANPKKIAAQVGADFWRQLGPAVRLGKAPSGGKAKAAIAEEPPPPAEEEAPPPPPEPKKKSKKAARAEEESEPAPAKAEEEGEGESKPSRKRAEPAPAEEEEASSPSGAAVGPALTLGVGGRALFRRLDWNQDVARLPPYSLSPGPQASVWLEAYPAALASSKGFAGNVGVFGSFNLGFGVTSTTTDGAKLTTKFQDFLGGLKVRLPVNAFTPYVSLAYGAQNFSLQSSTGASSIVPSVAYKFLRVGLGTRVAIGSVASLEVGAAYLLVTDTGSKAGEIKSQAYFPNTKANAVDLGLSVSYRLMKWVGVRAGVDFRQYGLDFKVTPQSMVIVGGATDRYITAGAGVEIVLDGPGGGAAAGEDDDEAEPEPPPPPPKKKKKKAEESEE